MYIVELIVELMSSVEGKYLYSTAITDGVNLECGFHIHYSVAMEFYGISWNNQRIFLLFGMKRYSVH